VIVGARAWWTRGFGEDGRSQMMMGRAAHERTSRYDGDQVTVLFDEHGYRDLLVPLVIERGLLR
jgi:hypothetical protein